MVKLLLFAALVAYFGGVWKFWKGFERTNFDRSFSNKLYLSLLWPALFAANQSYRRNFRKALKG